jgi:acyl-CoA reductase-like NAD-dependent aldehyde dehydrogenase
MSVANVAGVEVDTRHWIGGQRAASAAAFTDLSPIDEQPLAEVARGGQAEVAAAVRAASDAFGGWSATPPKDRAAVLHAIADGIESRAAELAAVETADNGALLRSHVRSVMPRAAHNFRFFAGWLGELDGGDLDIRGHREEVSWAPSGVTAVITPWNAPLMLATWRIAPALAAGNTVVAKPPEWAPLTAGLLADITRAAGLPDGVFNVVQGLGARFTERARVLRQGDPRDDTTDIGPNITREHLERVDGFVRRAVAAGARPVLGGAVNPELGGLYYQPTLLTGAAPGSEILTEEVFGPVLTLQTFDGEAEAVTLANSTRYGLAATMFTGDQERASRVSARLVAGTVWVNCFFVRDLRAPFGGARQSGIGREGGTWSFDFYGDVKNTVYAPEGWHRNG